MLQSVLAKSKTNETSKTSKKKKPEGFSKHYKKKDALRSETKRRSVFCLAKEYAQKRQQQLKELEKEDSVFAAAVEQFFNKQLTDHTTVAKSIDKIETTSEAVLLTEKLSSMVHYVNSSGITKTSMELSSDGFDTLKNTSVTITHFDTAPNSFHVEFFSDVAGAKLLSQNVDLLQNHLEGLFTKSTFFLAKPVYSSDFTGNKKKKEKIPTVNRKKSA
ncbi:MAG: hypothetical protein S4CHLAM37_12410 [Chlamydiia bacterium]|nr:hypothetical protein [Chlamydiia bacterium]